MPVKLLVCDDDEGVVEVVSFAANMTWSSCEVSVASNGDDPSFTGICLVPC